MSLDEQFSIRDTVISEISRVLVEDGIEIMHIQETDNLTDCGLDSLGFAVLITRLEETLGQDPFVDADLSQLPQTVGELIQLCNSAIAP